MLIPRRIGLIACSTCGFLAASSLNAQLTPEKLSTFTSERGVPSLVVSPTSGPIGTVITINLTPQTAEFALDDATATVEWTGVYNPVVGSPSSSFTVDYSASEVDISGMWQAKIVLGGGVMSGDPLIDNLDNVGVLSGTLRLIRDPVCLGDVNNSGQVNTADIGILIAAFGQTGPGLAADVNGDESVDTADLGLLIANFGLTCWINKQTTFSPDTDAGQWLSINYPDGFGGIDPPELGVEPVELPMFLLSTTVDPANPSVEMFDLVSSMHLTALLRVEENPSTLAVAPSSVLVDLISFSSTGVETDRLEDVTLTMISNDGDSNNIIYGSDLLLPVLIIDFSVNKSNYPGYLLLVADEDGSAVIAPSN